MVADLLVKLYHIIDDVLMAFRRICSPDMNFISERVIIRLSSVCSVRAPYSGDCVPTHNRVDLWWNLCTSLLYFVVRVRCCRKESSGRSATPLAVTVVIWTKTETVFV